MHPGTPITTISGRCAAETGLAVNTPVVAGMTDGCTSQIASGAVKPGDWNSTLGTPLVIKGVTQQLIADPLGRIYSHRHRRLLDAGRRQAMSVAIALKRTFPAQVETLNASIVGRR